MVMAQIMGVSSSFELQLLLLTFCFLFLLFSLLWFFWGNGICRDEIQRIKAGNPDISHREAFSAAAKNVSALP